MNEQNCSLELAEKFLKEMEDTGTTTLSKEHVRELAEHEPYGYVKMIYDFLDKWALAEVRDDMFRDLVGIAGEAGTEAIIGMKESPQVT